jgi:tetratricopeptide (TPR) repeat protein
VQSISDALNLLHEDGSWFARAHELRLWLVRCEASLRNTVLELLPKLEFHADNHSPWPLLLDAHTQADDGWQLRANGLAVDWARRVEAFAAAGIVQGSVAAVHGPSGLAAARATLIAIMRALGQPLDGVVLVLGPTIVEHVDRLGLELGQLLGDPALSRLRVVLVIDHELPLPDTLLHALGEARALVTMCRVDGGTQAADLRAMLSGDPKRMGVAWPLGVVAPPRIDEPPTLPPEQRDALLRAEGIDPAYLEHAPLLRAKLLGAAVAMHEGNGPAAILLQRDAVSLCAKLELFEMQVIAQTALATYLSGLGDRGAAKHEAKAAVELARARSLPRSESQALLALGLLHNLDRESDAAMRAYADSARAAERANEPSLAIEAWRTAGQLALAHREDALATDCFGQAIRVAQASPVELVQSSGAAEAARALAAVYERRSMAQQAASLHAQADAMEAGKVGTATPAEPPEPTPVEREADHARQ